jgi:putative transposase
MDHVFTGNWSQISIDGNGRWIDNVIVERFWRTIKYEDIYLKSYENPIELENGIKTYMQHYNHVRLHQSLSGSPPAEAFNQLMKRAA